MIGETKLSEIERMLAEGHPKAEIARKVGVSRNTVSDIAVGVSRRRIPRMPREASGSDTPREGEIERCPTCRCKVKLPCVLCEPEKYVLAED